MPLATYTGWNFGKPAIGAPNQFIPLLGSYVPFPRTKPEREQAHDPRMSIEDRYASRDRYLALVQEAAAALVKDRYPLADDLPRVVERAGERWDLLTHRTPGATK